MTAYLVFTRESTKDRAELATYSQQAGASLAGHAAMHVQIDGTFAMASFEDCQCFITSKGPER
jgi:hypothetical protein